MMQYSLTLLLISFHSLAFSQISFSEITRIYKMDLDQFEQYAIRNGYEIYEYKKEENSNGVCYAKGDFKQRRYITLFEFFNDYGRYVVFNTAISSELLAIKNQMKKSGYRLSKSYFLNDYKADEYKNNNYQVVIFTKPPNEEIDHVIYEIGFRKL